MSGCVNVPRMSNTRWENKYFSPKPSDCFDESRCVRSLHIRRTRSGPGHGFHQRTSGAYAN
jgi:hypothetical protein